MEVTELGVIGENILFPPILTADILSLKKNHNESKFA